MFWALENSIFPIFECFWVTKLKPFSGKVRQSVQNYLKKNMVIGSFLKMVLKLSWAKKHIFWAFEKNIFQFFASFWETKLKPFSGKLRQNVQNYWNLNLVIRSFLEKGFEATLSSKANVLSVWKDHFFEFFATFWMTKLKQFSGKVKQSSGAKRWKLFKLKLGHKKLLRKRLWTYLRFKRECCERFKKLSLNFLKVFVGGSWNFFGGNWRKALKTI